MPADGSSEALVGFKVTDINDNPNAQVPVGFSILEGSGSMSENYMLTDRNGEGFATFVSGRRSGTVVIDEDTTIANAYNPRLTAPFTILIDRRGKIYKKIEGFQLSEAAHLEAEVKQLLGAR